MKSQNAESVPAKPQSFQPSDRDSVDTATLELLASWRSQDATSDPEEIRAAELELAEFKRSMNGNRLLTGGPILYP